jgi:EAL domain-containing protein (putative c-di-GMP-specific phosphodiesterase class I)
MFPEDGADGETLIKNADAAMYCAKDDGMGKVREYADAMNSATVAQLTLEHDLRSALEAGEFLLEYQPQMEIATGRITGIEALLRWQHPTLGLVPPDRFIPVAENSGLILPIGEWVLRTACVQAQQWRRAGLKVPPVSVNVSALQFRQEGFCSLTRRALEDSGLPLEYLELELTESVLFSSADVMQPVLEELKAMGVALAIDDFGTGYSSLSYLKQFRVGKLKIDRSFIQDVVTDSDAATITTAIIRMGRSLAMRVLAEGVETEAQLAFLREQGCDEIQGYYLSRPMGSERMANFLGSVASAQAELLQR